jgi:transcriptional regulator with XRE-family HTH domain
MESVSFGFWVRRRRKALDLTQAVLAHRVGCATATIKKIEHNERRPSRLMAQRLADQLQVPPAERDFFIHSATGEAYELPPGMPATPEAPYPTQLAETLPQNSTSGAALPFVGREPELTWLERKLSAALDGEGQMVFISGDAGRGKTVLMAEFARRAIQADPDLVVFSGACSMLAGYGDPFLPLREVLAALTGELAWFQHPENTRRIWQALPNTLQALVETAPDLLEGLVPGNPLLHRARELAPGGAGWLVQLQAEVLRRRQADKAPAQDTVYGQFTSLLLQAARRQPLLIMLDDLHWSDEASLGSLFHLCRKLAQHRILVVGAYRPEEFQEQTEKKQPAFEQLINETRRLYGEAVLDLASADQLQGKQFVDAYLKSLPNQFSQAFSQTLYQQTGGHPLFTVEFVSELQTRGILAQNTEGYWYEKQPLDWVTLPARVEAVIAQHFSRLPPDLSEILAVASVEGEQFTVEVVARALGMPERKLVRRLAGELSRQHRLVVSRGELDLYKRSISAYAFRHVLFQVYAYSQLDPGERRRMHHEVAEALEELYQDEVEVIASQLAWHYQEAHQAEKAVISLHMAGNRTIRLGGFDQAIQLLRRGLALLADLPQTVENVRRKMDLSLSLGEAYHLFGQIDEASAIYLETAATAREWGLPQVVARAAVGYEDARWRFNLPVEQTRRLLEESIERLELFDPLLQVRLMIGLARVNMHSTAPEQFYQQSEQAIKMARELADPTTLYDALYLKFRDRRPQLAAERIQAMDEMVALAEASGDISRQHQAINMRIFEHFGLGNMGAIQNELEAMRKLTARAYIPFSEYSYLIVLATLAFLKGEFEQAEEHTLQTRQIGHQLTVENVEGVFSVQMFSIRREQGRLKELAPLVKLFVAQHQQAEVWQPGLALIYTDLEMREEAAGEFEILAVNDFAAIPQDALWLTCMAYLAEVCVYLRDAQRAGRLYHFLLPYAGRLLLTGYFGVCYGAIDRYLGMLAGCQQHWEAAERHFLQALEINQNVQALPWLAHTQVAYASALLERAAPGDQAQARRLLTEARQTAHRLGMVYLAEKIGKLEDDDLNDTKGKR